MTVVRFPSSRFAAVFVLDTADGWLVLAPRSHGWLFSLRADAIAEAPSLARNLKLPVREIA
jgi:hypothetical protein